MELNEANNNTDCCYIHLGWQSKSYEIDKLNYSYKKRARVGKKTYINTINELFETKLSLEFATQLKRNIERDFFLKKNYMNLPLMCRRKKINSWCIKALKSFFISMHLFEMLA